MTELQALVTGYLWAALALAPGRAGLTVDVEQLTDEVGNYVPEMIVTGTQSGARILVRVEVLP